MCPALNTVIELQGAYPSAIYKSLLVTIKECNNATDPSRPCATQAEVDALFVSRGHTLFSTLFMINSVVNPDSTEYIDNYLEDKHIATFGKSMGSLTGITLSDYVIDTDTSVWPF